MFAVTYPGGKIGKKIGNEAKVYSQAGTAAFGRK